MWKLFPYCLAVSEGKYLILYNQSFISIGAVRLVPYNSNINLVEIYYEQQWLPVYDHDWTLQDATVICNQLGYQTTVTTQTLTCSPPTTSVVISELICNREDVAISQCNITVSNNISSLHRAGVICASKFGNYNITKIIINSFFRFF